eukprot:IDg6905t1
MFTRTAATVTEYTCVVELFLTQPEHRPRYTSMSSPTEENEPAGSGIWEFVQLRDIWKLDQSALIVEANDGEPYCVIPSHNAYLVRQGDRMHLLLKMAQRGNSSGNFSEIARDLLRRFSDAGLHMSRFKTNILRSRISDAHWRLKWLSSSRIRRDNAIRGLMERLEEHYIPLFPPGPVIENRTQTSGGLTCDYVAWISVLSSWLAYYIQNPVYGTLFGGEQFVGSDEVGIEFNADEVARILNISPLAAACLWSIAVVICKAHEQQLGVTKETKEGVLMKYILGKLLIYAKGSLWHITREFGKEIARTELLDDKNTSTDPNKQISFRDKYHSNKKKRVFELEGADTDTERFECDYLTKCSSKNEAEPPMRIEQSNSAFRSFKSLATLSAFQIDHATQNAHHPKRSRLWRVAAYVRPAVADDSDQRRGRGIRSISNAVRDVGGPGWCDRQGIRARVSRLGDGGIPVRARALCQDAVARVHRPPGAEDFAQPWDGVLVEGYDRPAHAGRVLGPRETVGDSSVWGEKYIIDHCGCRELSSQSDGTIHVVGTTRVDSNGLVVVSLEGSRAIRGPAASGSHGASDAGEEFEARLLREMDGNVDAVQRLAEHDTSNVSEESEVSQPL